MATKPLIGEILATEISDERIPTYDELYIVERALATIQEHLTSRIFQGVRTVCERGAPDSVSFEQIGQMVTWAQHVRDRMEEIESDVAAVALMAHQAYAMASGYNGDGTPFRQVGSQFTEWPVDDVNSAMKKIGFGDVA